MITPGVDPTFRGNQIAQFAAYPHKKRTNIGGAMRLALIRFLKGFEFNLPASVEPFQFAEVYDSWALFEDAAKSAGGKLPAAAIETETIVYDDSTLTAAILEDTWVSNGGQGGWALFTSCEAVMQVTGVARAKSKPQREAILSTLEDQFTEFGDADSIRFGKLLPLPDYYDRTGRFTLFEARPLDGEDTTAANRWFVEFKIEAHGIVLQPRWIPGLRAEIRLRDGNAGVDYTR